ncbi:MAG TPA: cyclic nucleotide-binding domain-containing protein [Solirubrobacteraceae bacterium]|nr:cyclic nucleotide-binding domain-containing protein [Solirubrobacteraceae bacterium]
MGFRFLPGALSSALVAPIVDSRPGILTTITSLRVVVLGLGAAAVFAKLDLAIVLVVTSIDATIAAGYRPAQARLLPTLAREPADISAGAAGVSMVKTLGQAAGAFLGGVGAAVFAPDWAMAGAAVVMGGAAALTIGLDRQATAGVRVRGALKAGIAAIPEVFSDQEAAPLVIASGLRTLVRGLWTALLVIVALKLFGLGASGVGVLSGAAGVGALIALPIVASLTGRQRLAGPCAIAFVAIGVALILVGVLPSGVVVIAVVCGWGISMAIADATSLALLHRLLDAATVSRTVGVMESLKLGSEGLGALLAPALVGLFGIRPALILAGVPLPLTIVSSLPQLRKADQAAAGRGLVVTLLHGVGVLRSLDMASLEDVAARARRLEVEAGTEVIRYGEEGDDFYVIADGEAEVLLLGFRVARLTAGAGFGERALLRSTTRAATVRALTPLTLFVVDRISFLCAATNQPPEALDGIQAAPATRGSDLATRPLAGVLGDVPLLRELDDSGLERLAEVATIEDWETGAVVIREGDSGAHMFVILAGRARTIIHGEHDRELLPGDAFGEIAVIHRVPRTATVAASEPLRTCRLAIDALTEIIAAHGSSI